MENDREKIKEPYQPEDTPQPPQRIDPDAERKRENPVEDERSAGKPDHEKQKKSEKSHLLDEESDISDETTV